MKKKVVFFDLDGTLLDTRKDIHASINKALKDYDFKEVSFDEAVKNTGKGNLNLVKESMMNERLELLPNVFNSFIKHYKENPYDYTVPYNGINDVLNDLKNKGYKLVVYSNKDYSLVFDIINHFFPSLFDIVLGIKEGVELKPSNKTINKVLNDLAVNHDEALYVGDSLVDYHTAINSNIDYMIVSYGFRSKEELELEVKNNLEDNIYEIYKYL